MGIEEYIFISILILLILALIYLIIKKIKCKKNITDYRKNHNSNQNMNLNMNSKTVSNIDNINNVDSSLNSTNHSFDNNQGKARSIDFTKEFEFNINKDIYYEIHTNGTDGADVVEDRTDLLINMNNKENSIKDVLTNLEDKEDKTEILLNADDRTEILINNEDKTEILMDTERNTEEKPDSMPNDNITVNEKKYIRLTNLANNTVVANSKLEDGLQIAVEKTGKIVFNDLSVVSEHSVLQIADREGLVFCIKKTALYSVVINGRKLEENEEMEIYSGALLTLGNIKIKVEISE